MKQIKFYLIAIIAAAGINTVLLKPLNAQSFSDAVSYMNYIGNEYREITNDVMSYTSAVAHGKSARKQEKKRKELLQTALNAKKKIEKMPDFQGDHSLRDTAMSFLKLNYNVLNYDYAKIVDMEEIAEQSYDLMEAYLMALEIANEKLAKAFQVLVYQRNKFAEKHNINIIEKESKLSKKTKITNEVYKYYNKVYLIFFKSFKQEAYLLDALAKNDMNAVVQNKNALIKSSTEDLKKLDSISSFNGDISLKTACHQMLTFYKSEATNKIPVFIDFHLKKENFEKIKAAFEAKRESERTKEDYEQFNNGVKDFNESVNKNNAINNKLNEERAKLINSWNKTTYNFLDKYIPRHK